MEFGFAFGLVGDQIGVGVLGLVPLDLQLTGGHALGDQR